MHTGLLDLVELLRVKSGEERMVGQTEEVAILKSDLYTKHNVDDGIILAAQQAFAADSDVIHLLDEVQRLLRGSAVALAAPPPPSDPSPAAASAASGSGGPRPPLSKDELLAILYEMHSGIKRLVASIKLLQDAMKPAEEIMAAQSEGVAKLESDLHTKYNVNEGILVAAQEAYVADPDVIRLLDEIQRLYYLGDSEAKAPQDLTVEQYLAKLQLQNNVVSTAITAIFEEVRASGRRGMAAVELFQTSLVTRLADVESSAPEVTGLSQLEMMAAFMKFATDGRVAEAAMFVQTLVERKMQEILMF